MVPSFVLRSGLWSTLGSPVMPSCVPLPDWTLQQVVININHSQNGQSSVECCILTTELLLGHIPGDGVEVGTEAVMVWRWGQKQ